VKQLDHFPALSPPYTEVLFHLKLKQIGTFKVLYSRHDSRSRNLTSGGPMALSASPPILPKHGQRSDEAKFGTSSQGMPESKKRRTLQEKDAADLQRVKNAES